MAFEVDKFSDTTDSPKRRIMIVTTIMLLILGLAGTVYYSNEKHGIRTHNEDKLRTISTFKAGHLSNWYLDELHDAELVGGNEIFLDLVAAYIRNPTNDNTDRLERQLTSIKREHGYEDVFIVTRGGKRVFPASITAEHCAAELTTTVDSVLQSTKPLSTDIYSRTVLNELSIDFVCAIPLLSTQPLVLVCRFDPSGQMYPYIDYIPVLSRSLETYIAERQGDSIVVLNNLRHLPASALSHRYSLNDSTSAIVRAVHGYTGIVDAYDYRGMEVLAYVCRIGGTPWFMVTKIDQSEMYEDLYFDTGMIVGLSILIIFALIIGLGYIHSNRQRNMYRDLWRLQEEFRATLYSIADAVITTDSSGRIRYLNTAAESLTGWNEHDIQGKQFDVVCEILVESTGQRIDGLVTKALHSGARSGFTNGLVFLNVGGKRIPILESASVIRDAKGERTGVVLVLRDQTEQRRRLRMIEESEIKFRSLFESAFDAIALYELSPVTGNDEETAILIECNARFASLSTNVPEYLRGTTIETHCPTESELMLEAIRDALNNDRNSVFELYAASLRHHFIVSVYRSGSARVAIQLHDITERKNAEVLLTQKIEELERFNRVTIDRELRMVELKAEVNTLLAQQNIVEKYSIVK